MAKLNEAREQKSFLSIGANGVGKTYLLQSVPENTVNAVRRDWEVGGDKGTKYELCYEDVSGMITDIKIEDGKYGTSLNIEIDGDLIVTTKADGKFGGSLMRTLPNVDLTKPVKLIPFSYIPKGKTKESTGVWIRQGENFDIRIDDNFYDFEKKESKNGMPTSDFDWATAPDKTKKRFWMDVDDFLQEYTTKNVIPNVVPMVTAQEINDANAENQIAASESLDGEFPQEDINPEDIPF